MKRLLLDWMSYQCQILAGARYAKLLTATPGDGPFSQVLFWPSAESDHAALSRVAQTAMQSKKAVIESRSDMIEETGEPIDSLACPLFVNNQFFGVIAIAMSSRSQAMQQAAIKQIQAGSKLLEMIIQLYVSSSEDKKTLLNIVESVSTGLDHDCFNVAAAAAANELAERFSCHRVSIGFLGFRGLRIETISHNSRFDKDSNTVQNILSAMSESLDQGATVVYPNGSDDTFIVRQFHKILADEQNGEAICTIPFIHNGKSVGAILLERSLEMPFKTETVKQCEQISLLLGAILEIRRRDEQPIFYRSIDSLQGWLKNLFGPKHFALKSACCLLAALVVFLSIANSTYRISADAVIEADVNRVVVSPQQGYISTAYARAGDFVQEGDLMAALDDKELRLEQRKWQSQLAQIIKEYRQALAGFDRSEVLILNAKKEQAEAQLELVEGQLSRMTITAPFSGLVIKGDLSQSLGSPVDRGEVLYEVASTDAYRVVLKVDDRDIGSVSLSKQGNLKLSGIPDKAFGISISRMTPVASTDGGRNYFRVEAMIQDHSDLMRPGMEGHAKIEIGRRKLIWIFTRPVVNWLRLFIWNRLP